MEKYQYYLDEFADYYTDLYRMPNNGKGAFENSAVAGNLEKYSGKGVWISGDKDVRRLQNGESNGEFNFRNAEIKNQSEVDKIIEKIDNKLHLK